MNKIPCVLCNSELWEYISPNLIKWGYQICKELTSNWNLCQLLIINRSGYLGLVDNVNFEAAGNYNRKLVISIEEFLEKAAELKGFIYKRKDIMKINGIEIKPGMVIETQSKDVWVVFPTEKRLAVINYQRNDWYLFENFIKYFKDDIEAIYSLPDEFSLTGGIKLWEKSKEIVLTMGQIAEKFGVPVEQLKIKK